MSLLTGTCKLGTPKHLGEALLGTGSGTTVSSSHSPPVCQGSSSTKVLQDVTEHPCTILGTGHSLVRRISGSAPEEVASPAPCSPQDTSGSPVPGPWGGSSGDRADTRPGSVGVWHEPSCPCSALRQGAKKSLN